MESRVDLNWSRNTDYNSSDGKVTSSIKIKTDNVHMMSSDDETNKSNSSDSKTHSKITKDRLTITDKRHGVTNDTEDRNDNNVDFRMTKESE